MESRRLAPASMYWSVRFVPSTSSSSLDGADMVMATPRRAAWGKGFGVRANGGTRGNDACRVMDGAARCVNARAGHVLPKIENETMETVAMREGGERWRDSAAGMVMVDDAP